MDIRTTSRRFGVVALVVGPAAVALGTLFEPKAGSTSDALTWVSRHPTAVHVGAVIGFGALFIVPAMIYLMRLARRGSPRLALYGGAIATTGWLAGLCSVATLDVLAKHAASIPDRSAAIVLVDRYSNDPTFGVLELTFVVGHLVGMLLLGIALFRARAVPKWAAVLVGAIPIVHAGTMMISPVADAGAYAVLTVAMAGCAWALWHTPDDEWDLAGATVPETPIAIPVGAGVAPQLQS